ncbi:nucleotidyl transferase AbiEii/AbiGii toxin family protein [Azospirillum endophyticum]
MPNFPAWQTLLERALRGIAALEAKETPLRFYSFGGGTALMLQSGHRLSKDIDFFIHDPQYISLLSPRLGGEEIWDSQDYDEAAHYLKVRYPEGEIDFIVSSRMTAVPLLNYDFRGWTVPMEHAVEIAIKKMYHRAEGLKPRDIFDVAVVMTHHAELLKANLHLLHEVKASLVRRLQTLPQPYYERNLEDLEILPEWDRLKPAARGMVAGLVEQIPDRRP